MANPEDLGRYRLKRLLGRGVLGQVWEASDLEQPGGKVAVKIMHAIDDELAIARIHFAREARLATLIRHPNVVVIHDAGEAAGTSFLVMEMVEGTSLRALMRDGRPTTAEKLQWLRQIGDGLWAMHQVGVVHRDLKPENVIVRADGTACLVDLGIAKWTKFDLGGERDFDSEIEAAVEPRRPTSDYVPPETTDRQLYDELGDQYAFGVLAYELLTGATPQEGSPPLTDREDVPHAMAVAIGRARSEDRDDRWDGMDLLLDELVGDGASPSSGSRPPRTQAPGTPSEPEEPNSNRPVHPELSDAQESSRLSPLVMGAVVALLVFLALATAVATTLR